MWYVSARDGYVRLMAGADHPDTPMPAVARMLADAALAATAWGLANPPPAPAAGWLLVAAGLALAFVAGNLGLQYGAARLAAGTTALVMLSEVLFASVSSVLLDAANLAPRMLMGGALIVLAALLALWPRRSPGK